MEEPITRIISLAEFCKSCEDSNLVMVYQPRDSDVVQDTLWPAAYLVVPSGLTFEQAEGLLDYALLDLFGVSPKPVE
jgi:hypothetical protein